MFALSAAGALAAALTCCGSENKHETPVVTAAPGVLPPSSGPLPNTLMIIRHAEKPTGSGAPYGITEAGQQDKESLTTRGWTRAGALVALFDPRGADGNPMPTRPGISRPATIFAARPATGSSKRSQETVTPIAAALNLVVDTRFTKGQEADLAAALAGVPGPVLVAWQREQISAIIAHLGTVAPAPPASWPEDRFDVVYVFTRSSSSWTFTQLPQMLLAGDSPILVT